MRYYIVLMKSVDVWNAGDTLEDTYGVIAENFEQAKELIIAELDQTSILAYTFDIVSEEEIRPRIVARS